jgi:hypothetical protein
MNKPRFAATAGIALTAAIALTGCAASVPTVEITSYKQLTTLATAHTQAKDVVSLTPDPSKTNMATYKGDLTYSWYKDANGNHKVDKADGEPIDKWTLSHKTIVAIQAQFAAQAKAAADKAAADKAAAGKTSTTAGGNK